MEALSNQKTLVCAGLLVLASSQGWGSFAATLVLGSQLFMGLFAPRTSLAAALCFATLSLVAGMLVWVVLDAAPAVLWLCVGRVVFGRGSAARSDSESECAGASLEPVSELAKEPMGWTTAPSPPGAAGTGAGAGTGAVHSAESGGPDQGVPPPRPPHAERPEEATNHRGDRKLDARNGALSLDPHANPSRDEDGDGDIEMDRGKSGPRPNRTGTRAGPYGTGTGTGTDTSGCRTEECAPRAIVLASAMGLGVAAAARAASGGWFGGPTGTGAIAHLVALWFLLDALLHHAQQKRHEMPGREIVGGSRQEPRFRPRQDTPHSWRPITPLISLSEFLAQCQLTSTERKAAGLSWSSSKLSARELHGAALLNGSGTRSLNGSFGARGLATSSRMATPERMHTPEKLGRAERAHDREHDREQEYGRCELPPLMAGTLEDRDQIMPLAILRPVSRRVPRRTRSATFS